MFKDGFKVGRIMTSSNWLVKEKFNLGNKVFIVSCEGKAVMNHTNDDGALQNSRCVATHTRETLVEVLRFFKDFGGHSTSCNKHSQIHKMDSV